MKKIKIKRILGTVLTILMAASIFSGCSGSKKDSSTGSSNPANSSADKPVSLRWIFYGDMTPRRDSFFKKEFHDALLKDINVDIKVETLAWGSNNTIATMLASGEDFGFYNILSSNDWASKGYLAKFDENVIKKNATNYLSARGDNGFECVKYNGEIYTIPFGNKAYSGRMQTFEVRNDILKTVGYDADKIKTYDDFMKALDAVHKAQPNLRITQSVGFFNQALNSVIDSKKMYYGPSSPIYAVVDELEQGDKVYSYYESEYFKKLCEITADWYKRGFSSQDLITNPSQGLADWNAGKCLLLYGTPGALVDTNLKQVAPNAELKLIKIGDMPNLKTTNYDWGISISKASESKTESWLRFFDWLYASQKNYDMAIYGVEGTDFKVENGAITKLVKDSFIDNWFLIANKFAQFEPSIPKVNVDAYKAYDNGSLLSKTTGFVFDSSKVASQVAAMNAVQTELLNPMANGILDYKSNIDNAIKKLKAAGSDEYMKEYQKQFSEWYAKNHK